jgi:hypothetical protein
MVLREPRPTVEALLLSCDVLLDRITESVDLRPAQGA